MATTVTDDCFETTYREINGFEQLYFNLYVK